MLTDVSSRNITNFNLEIAAPVIHKAIPLAPVPIVRMDSPCSWSDDTPNVLWSTHKS